jgi:Tol biopolymer transport system component
MALIANRVRSLLIANRLRTLLIGGGILLLVVAVPVGLLILSFSGMGGQQEVDGDQHHKAASPNDKRPAGSVSQQATDDIAFVANGELSVIDTDGTGQIYLTDTPTIGETNYDWSPGGEEITFVRDGSVYVLNADGTGLRKLTDTYVNGREQPDWSPVGEKIVFVSTFVFGGGNKDLYIVNADGTDERNLTGNGVSEQESSPAFSPDGKKVAFVLNDDIYLIRADGIDQTDLTGNGASARESSPTYSPDGKKIAFIRDRTVRSDDGERWYSFHDLYVMNADGTGQTRLVKNVNAAPYPYLTDIAFSPDSKKIAFVRDETARTSNASEGFAGTTDIYVVNADGNGVRKLTDTPTASEEDPAWSPDGEKIAFQRCCENASEIAKASARGGPVPIKGIYVMNADGTGVTKLTDTPVYEPMDIQWRPVEPVGSSHSKRPLALYSP